MMNKEKELLNKINNDKNYRSDILIDLNVSLQFLEHYTYTQEGKVSPTEYKLAVVSLESENKDLQQRIDKAIEYIKIYRSYENIDGKDYLKGRDEIGNLGLSQVDELLEILGGKE